MSAGREGPPPAKRPGGAHRAPGRLGDTPEPIETDVVTSARQVRANVDDAAVSSPGDTSRSPRHAHVAAPGTSETSRPVEGARTPAE